MYTIGWWKAIGKPRTGLDIRTCHLAISQIVAFLRWRYYKQSSSKFITTALQYIAKLSPEYPRPWDGAIASSDLWLDLWFIAMIGQTCCAFLLRNGTIRLELNSKVEELGPHLRLRISNFDATLARKHVAIMAYSLLCKHLASFTLLLRRVATGPGQNMCAN